MKKFLFVIPIIIMLISCSGKVKVDLLVYNATVYTVDDSFTVAEAIVVKDGKIVAVGKTVDLEKKYDAKEKWDADGKFIYPGFIDAHAHFVGYGNSLQRVMLAGTESWDEVIKRTTIFAAANPDGWILGRGWDQNDWAKKDFPDNSRLNELFPDRPVLLTRIDGHAAIANQKALNLAGIRKNNRNEYDKIVGGEIEVKKVRFENGDTLMLTGILIDNAVDLVSSKIPSQSLAIKKQALLNAQKNCFAVGLTTVDDCGLGVQSIELIDSLQKTGDLKMRIYAMLSDDRENYDYIFKKGKINTGKLHVCAIKVYADGALGSRGACLLNDYSDKPGWKGFLLSSPEHFDSVARVIAEHGFQMCTHAIGDSGNRILLKIYSKYLKGKNDLRWRIEHAQVINANDFSMFGDFSIIPSVQPTHATSDMYWAGDRLGPERVKGAYAYKQLLQQNNWIPLGTDFPVEDISPFKTFYAAVVRQDAKGWPEGGYQMENALNREEALRGMTTWAARSNFEEKEKGSLEKGKWADLIILDADLMKIPAEKLLQVNVLRTYVGGEKVYEKNMIEF